MIGIFKLLNWRLVGPGFSKQFCFESAQIRKRAVQIIPVGTKMLIFYFCSRINFGHLQLILLRLTDILKIYWKLKDLNRAMYALCSTFAFAVKTPADTETILVVCTGLLEYFCDYHFRAAQHVMDFERGVGHAVSRNVHLAARRAFLVVDDAPDLVCFFESSHCF